MSERFVLRGKGRVPGIVEGEALVSQDPLVWSHGVDPATGKIDDVRVALNGVCIKGKILVYPYGKGSTASSSWMLETTRCGNNPLAILNRKTELIIIAGAVLSDVLYQKQIPIVDLLDQNPDEVIRTGDWVIVDGNQGTVEIIRK